MTETATVTATTPLSHRSGGLFDRFVAECEARSLPWTLGALFVLLPATWGFEPVRELPSWVGSVSWDSGRADGSGFTDTVDEMMREAGEDPEQLRLLMALP